MNENIFNQGIKNLKKTIVLGSDEKRFMLERIAEAEIERESLDIVSPMSWYSICRWTKGHPYWSFATFVVLLLLMSGGGVTMAAQSALPGDKLYPIKTNILETVEGAVVANTPNAQAVWHLQEISARLGEAFQLAANGKLNDSNEAKLLNQINDHSVAFSKAAAALDRENATASISIISNFTTTMNRYAKALEAIATTTTDVNRGPISNIANALQKQITQIGSLIPR
ncbi:MAG: hypothetical protein KGJ35_00365 [Patescibacteria group bacterium]|nr:hypothetical protein [Patescibacteria group bacterium]